MTTTSTDYTLLPGHIRHAIREYIEHGWLPGFFLKAVICNDLANALGYADDINRERLHDIVKFFYNEVPGTCWGSKARMIAWSQHQGLENLPEEL